MVLWSYHAYRTLHSIFAFVSMVGTSVVVLCFQWTKGLFSTKAQWLFL